MRSKPAEAAGFCGHRELARGSAPTAQCPRHGAGRRDQPSLRPFAALSFLNHLQGSGKSWEGAALEPRGNYEAPFMKRPLASLVTSMLTIAQISQAPNVALSAEDGRTFRGS